MVNRLDGLALPPCFLGSISGASGYIYTGPKMTSDPGARSCTSSGYVWDWISLETSTRKVFWQSLPPMGWLKEKGRLINETKDSQLVDQQRRAGNANRAHKVT